MFENQTEFFDVNVVNETRNKTYERLSMIAASVGVDQEKFLQLLTVSEKPGKDGRLDVGNGVTSDITLMIKVHEWLYYLLHGVNNVSLSRRIVL